MEKQEPAPPAGLANDLAVAIYRAALAYRDAAVADATYANDFRIEDQQDRARHELIALLDQATGSPNWLALHTSTEAH